MIRTNIFGKKIISVNMPIDINETVDVDISINLDEFIDRLSDNDMVEIAKLFNLNNEEPCHHTYEGEGLKRHLCDIVGSAYTITVNDLLYKLSLKINS